MKTAGVKLKQRLMRELDELPPDKLMEILDFVVFLRTRRFKKIILSYLLSRLLLLIT